MTVCLCSNTVSCLGIEVSSHVWEWMVGLLHGFKHEEGVLGAVGQFLPPALSTSSELCQAACSLVLEEMPFHSSCGLDPTSPFPHLLGGWWCRTFTALPSAFGASPVMREQNELSSVPQHWEPGKCSVAVTWEPLPLCWVRLPSCHLSLLLEDRFWWGRPRDRSCQHRSIFTVGLPNTVPHLPSYFLSQLFCRRFLLPEIPWLPVLWPIKKDHIWSNNLSYIVLFT